MKKILIYSETILYLKGINLLINEGIHDIKTVSENNVIAFEELLSKESPVLIILHFDFLNDASKYQQQIISLLPQHTPVLILTDDTINAGKLFPATIDHICFLDVKNTAMKIISTINKMLSITKLNNTTT